MKRQLIGTFLFILVTCKHNEFENLIRNKLLLCLPKERSDDCYVSGLPFFYHGLSVYK